MCVSLTQVGLLRLTEAYFVLLGANLGTTVTGWLVALTVDKPSIGGLALPMLAAALPFLFARRRRYKSFAEAVIGFCLMFIGLGLLREGVPPITEAGLAGFLGQNAVIGVGLTDSVDNDSLGGNVHIGYEIVASFCLNIAFIGPVESLGNEVSSLAGRAQGNICHGLHRISLSGQPKGALSYHALTVSIRKRLV